MRRGDQLARVGRHPTDKHERPLRVLLLNERCHRNPLAGGAEVHLVEVFSRLADAGLQVELLCCGGFEGAAPRDQHRGIGISRLGGRLSYYARLPREVRRRVRAGEVDLIVEALNKVPFLTPLHASVPVVAIHHHLHGLTAFRQVSPPIAAVSVLIEQLLPFVYRKCPLLTISHSSKLELVRRGLPEEAIDVVPCGIDHETHRPPASLGGREPLLVSVGRLEPYKRIDLLLRAFHRVHEARPDARLAIIGRGQEESRLRQLARRLGVEDAVTFTGFVDEAEKVRWLQRAALHVQCSRKEGWGLTVIEGYACGTPVVATDVPGLRDAVQDGFSGVLVKRARPRVLAAALLKLLGDERKRVQMARYALSVAWRFDWDAAARDVHATIARCLPAGRIEPPMAPERPNPAPTDSSRPGAGRPLAALVAPALHKPMYPDPSWGGENR